MRNIAFVALVMSGALAGPPAPAQGPWAWPVGEGTRPVVAVPFKLPVQQWDAGHRGIDLVTRPGADVTSVADGVVTHRGRIAGRGTVSVTHPGGVRSTYEPVDSTLAVGQRVRRGQRIAGIGHEPGHCAPGTCLHLGAKRGATYLDPMTFFGARRVVLLPLD